MDQTNITNFTQANISFPKSGTGLQWDIFERQFLIAFYCIVFLSTVAGNSLVCAAIYVDRRLRSHTNWFIASLAVSDLLYACVSLPFRIAQQATLQQISVYACDLWVWADMVCAAASIANLAVISVDRYIKITKPFSYHLKMTNKRAFAAIGGVWIYAVILASFSLVNWTKDTKVLALPNGGCLNSGNEIFNTVATVVGFLTPLVILVVNYCLVFGTALKQFNKMQEVNSLKPSKEEKRKHRHLFRDFKATKTLAIVIGTFCLCWCPFFILFVISQHAVQLNIKPPWDKVVFFTFTLILPNLNSACNPIIYAYFNTDFRRAFQKIVLRFCATKGAYIRARKNSASASMYSAVTHHGRLSNSVHSPHHHQNGKKKPLSANSLDNSDQTCAV